MTVQGSGRPRPTGVTILTILQIVIGVIDILSGLILLFIYAVAAAIVGMEISAVFRIFLLPLAVLSFVFAAFSFVMAYGLWTGRGWAWLVSIIVAAIGTVLSVIGLLLGNLANIAPIILYFLVIIYLTRYNVRSFFGHAPMLPEVRPPSSISEYAPPSPLAQYQQPVTPTPQIQQPSYPQPQAPSFPQPPGLTVGTCPACGNSIMPDANYCDRCGTRLR